MLGMMALLLSDNAGATFKADALKILFWIFTIVDALLVAYAVYIAFLFATATDAAKRTAAKSRLIKVFSSLLCIIALTMALKAMDINFGPVGGSNSNSGKQDWVDESKFSFIYVGNDEITLSAGKEYTITFDKSKIKDERDAKISENKLEFIECELSTNGGAYFSLPVTNEVLNSGRALNLKFKCLSSVPSVNSHYRNTIILRTYYRLGDDGKGIVERYVHGVLSIKYQGVPYSVPCYFPVESSNKKDFSFIAEVTQNLGAVPNWVTGPNAAV